MSDLIERLIQKTIMSAKDTTIAIDDQELEFEIWFNYYVSCIGERKLMYLAEIYDDSEFNMDGYQPTIFPVIDNYLKGMSTIGMDFIKPSMVSLRSPDDEDDLTFGSMIANEMANLHWVLFTVVEPDHPLNGVRYATAYSKGELVHPPYDPTFTDSYPDELVHGRARGIFIDTRERFLRSIRPELYKTGTSGALLK